MLRFLHAAIADAQLTCDQSLRTLAEAQRLKRIIEKMETALIVSPDRE
jgi:hypothetical protein